MSHEPAPRAPSPPRRQRGNTVIGHSCLSLMPHPLPLYSSTRTILSDRPGLLIIFGNGYRAVIARNGAFDWRKCPHTCDKATNFGQVFRETIHSVPLRGAAESVNSRTGSSTRTGLERLLDGRQMSSYRCPRLQQDSRLRLLYGPHVDV